LFRQQAAGKGFHFRVPPKDGEDIHKIACLGTLCHALDLVSQIS
jgi:hypothetical protein